MVTKSPLALASRVYFLTLPIFLISFFCSIGGLEGILMSIFFIPYAFFFALPGFILLVLTFWGLKYLVPQPAVAWSLLLAVVLGSTMLCCAFLHMEFGDLSDTDSSLNWAAVISALLGTLLNYTAIQNFFFKHYENKHNKEDYQDYADLLHD